MFYGCYARLGEHYFPLCVHNTCAEKKNNHLMLYCSNVFCVQPNLFIFSPFASVLADIRMLEELDWLSPFAVWHISHIKWLKCGATWWQVHNVYTIRTRKSTQAIHTNVASRPKPKRKKHTDISSVLMKWKKSRQKNITRMYQMSFLPDQMCWLIQFFPSVALHGFHAIWNAAEWRRIEGKTKLTRSVVKKLVIMEIGLKPMGFIWLWKRNEKIGR